MTTSTANKVLNNNASEDGMSVETLLYGGGYGPNFKNKLPAQIDAHLGCSNLPPIPRQNDAPQLTPTNPCTPAQHAYLEQHVQIPDIEPGA